MSFGKKVLSENRTLHIKISHKGDKNIKFKITSDSNKPRLSFMSAPSRKNTDGNEYSSSCSEKSDNPNPEPCGSSLVSGPEITHLMEDPFSDVISMVPVVYSKNTDMGPDVEKTNYKFR